MESKPRYSRDRLNPQQKLIACINNPVLFIQTFMYALNKSGNKVHFVLNPEQLILLNGLKNNKYNIVSKSRQLGISYVMCAYSLWLAITKPESTCFLIAHTEKATREVFHKLKQLYNDLPDCIKPEYVANNRAELALANGSRISCYTMSNSEIGRGSTIDFVHFSEVAFMKPDALEKNLLAIEQALAPQARIVLESTSNGINKFSEIYNKAEQKDSLYHNYFFPWYKDKVMFKLEVNQFTKAYNNISDHPLCEKDLDDDERELCKLGADLSQLSWRRMKIKNIGLEKFRQEFPSSFQESIIVTGNSVFNTEHVIKAYNNVKANVKECAFNCPKDLIVYRNYMKIWESPQKGDKYYMGIDCGEGVGQDYHVITILNQDLKECFQLRSNKIAPYEVAKCAYMLGKIYNNALIVVEKASGGNVVLDKLVHEYTYRNLYKHKEFDQKGKMIKKVGRVTSAKSKPLLIGDFVELFDNNDVYICSLDLLNEMKTYQYEDNGAMNGKTGFHDDTVISICLAYQGIKSNVMYY